MLYQWKARQTIDKKKRLFFQVMKISKEKLGKIKEISLELETIFKNKMYIFNEYIMKIL